MLGMTAAPPSPAGLIVPNGEESRSTSLSADHRYRIAGKIRLALFWIGRDDVGSARITWRSDGSTTAMALLVGSNPQRAPRSLNEWAYVREEIRSDRAEVFTLRTLDNDESARRAPVATGDGPQFGVSCASMKDRQVNSAVTTVNAGGATYRTFDRLLDRIAASRQWEERRTPLPPGTDAGFLTALQRLMRTSDRSPTSSNPVSYVYGGKIYDLSLRGAQRLGRTTVGTRTFDRLIRADFAICNRTTRDVTKFGVTYSPDTVGAVSLPVQIFFQPNFWLSIEFQLDDAADVPADPAADGSVLTRIRAICAAAER